MSVTAAVFNLLTSWLKEVAPLNMSFMVVTLLVSAQERAAPLLLKPVAPLNMPLMSVTAAVFHLLTSWLKEVAPLNMSFMVVTLLVSAQERAAPLLLKPVAPLNMPLMSVTAAVFHLLTSWLKEVAPLNMSVHGPSPCSCRPRSGQRPLLLKPVAPLNMPLMSVTAAVFHLLTSWLKEVAPLNMSFMVRHRCSCRPTCGQRPLLLKPVAPLNMPLMSVTAAVLPLAEPDFGMAALKDRRALGTCPFMVRHRRRHPRADVLGKYRGAVEHVVHVCHCCCVP